VITTVAIVGAGPAGLVAAHLLQRQGIPFVVLERRARSDMEGMAKAGSIDYRTVELLKAVGIAGTIVDFEATNYCCEFRTPNDRVVFDYGSLTGDRPHFIYPQHLLVAHDGGHVDVEVVGANGAEVHSRPHLHPERMGEGGQVDGLVEKLDPDQSAPSRQAKLGQALPMIEGQMGGSPRRIGNGIHGARIGADGKHEARAEGMGRAQQIAEIDGFGDALHTNGKISAGCLWQGFHRSLMSSASCRRRRIAEDESALQYKSRGQTKRCRLGSPKKWRVVQSSHPDGRKKLPAVKSCHKRCMLRRSHCLKSSYGNCLRHQQERFW